MRKSVEIIFNLVLWSIIIYIVHGLVAGYGHIAPNSYGMFHIPHLAYLMIFTLLPPAINFYFFYLFLVPKFLVHKKILLFILFALLASATTGIGFFLTFGGPGTTVTKLLVFTFMALFWGIMGSAVKGIFLWTDSLAEKKIIEKRSLMNRNALLMLKAQINPHFLFNSLNNIDILIDENPRTASEYLKKLSDILRYVVYETREDETDLSKEMDQIRSYIDLQKIRTDNPAYVNIRINGVPGNKKIAPMLFLPLIENAFKHCKNKTIVNAIDIEFEIKDTSVQMVCNNHYETRQVNIIKDEGIGIEIVKQRLNLLYPGKHKLFIEKSENRFQVNLQISL